MSLDEHPNNDVVYFAHQIVNQAREPDYQPTIRVWTEDIARLARAILCVNHVLNSDAWIELCAAKGGHEPGDCAACDAWHLVKGALEQSK